MTPKNSLSEEDQIRGILQENKDFSDYADNHPDYVLKFERLTPEMALEKQKSSGMKSLYEGLPDKMVYEVQADDDGRGIIAIVDIEDGNVLKITGFSRSCGVSWWNL